MFSGQVGLAGAGWNSDGAGRRDVFHRCFYTMEMRLKKMEGSPDIFLPQAHRNARYNRTCEKHPSARPRRCTNLPLPSQPARKTPVPATSRQEPQADSTRNRPPSLHYVIPVLLLEFSQDTLHQLCALFFLPREESALNLSYHRLIP